MLVLGIESTAHTFGVAILKDRRVLANVRKAYTTEKGGMIPVKVAQHHQDAYPEAMREALRQANVELRDIDLIAYSRAPGLGHTLRVGAAAAKSLALLLGKPLVGVNHAVAHLEVTTLATKAKDPVLLYVSGANTQVIAYADGRYRVFGEALDIGIGNLLDTLARMLGLGFPGGPKIEELAKRGKLLIQLPYSVKGMDVSFAGLETNLRQKIASKKFRREDLAFSVQEHCFAMLVEASERAMAHLGRDELALGGGVACNARLQEMCRIMCEERKARLYCPGREFLVDNAAMIAYTGWLMRTKGKTSVRVEDADVDPYERVDEVAVTWKRS